MTETTDKNMLISNSQSLDQRPQPNKPSVKCHAKCSSSFAEPGRGFARLLSPVVLYIYAHSNSTTALRCHTDHCRSVFGRVPVAQADPSSALRRCVCDVWSCCPLSPPGGPLTLCCCRVCCSPTVRCAHSPVSCSSVMKPPATGQMPAVAAPIPCT